MVMGFLIIPVIIILLLALFFTFVPVGLWISSLASGVHVGIFSLIGMKLRRVKPKKIILPMIKATKAGIQLNINELEAHYLAGGNVDGVVDALIASERAGIDLSFEKAAAIDLAGRNVLEAVKMSVNPKVIETPDISAVAKDGIELLVKARVTVRTNLERLVGGAGESTILARIGEGIVTTVGSSDSHKEVLENPDNISKLVLSKGLDSGTAFEILSIDIADIDVGRNIGAHLQSLQAEADKNIAQAKAEERILLRRIVIRSRRGFHERADGPGRGGRPHFLFIRKDTGSFLHRLLPERILHKTGNHSAVRHFHHLLSVSRRKEIRRRSHRACGCPPGCSASHSSP